MAAWIDERQGKENIYFTVNGLYGPVTSKPNKGAVAAIRALHVDVDPGAGEDPVTERARAWSLLRVLEPTAIIDSGGGLQAFWLLKEEVAVGGSAELAKLFWREMKPEARGPLSSSGQTGHGDTHWRSLKAPASPLRSARRVSLVRSAASRVSMSCQRRCQPRPAP